MRLFLTFRPEIWAGKGYGYETDLWALGCVVYEMAELKTPFYNKKIFELMKIICGESHQRIISRNYSQELKNLVDNLLRKNPKERPSLSKNF